MVEKKKISEKAGENRKFCRKLKGIFCIVVQESEGENRRNMQKIV